MATTGTEKYSRIVLILVKGGTKITRTLFEKRVICLSPLTVNDFLLRNKAAILKEKAGKNKEFTYFPRNGGKTDTGIWDMPMFCYILIQVCDLTTALRMYVRKLQNIRNKLSHMNDPTLSDTVYAEYIEKVDCCFQKCLEEINDTAFTARLDELVRSLKEGPLVLDDTLKTMHNFYKMEIQQIDILEKLDKGSEGQKKQMDDLISEFKLLNSRLPQDILVDVPSIGVVIEVKNCTVEKETQVVHVLINIFNDILSKTRSTMENALSNTDVHKIREAVEQTMTQFLQQGRHVVMVTEKCVMLMIKCTSPATLVDLLDDYRNDNLTRQLNALEIAIRTVDGCADVKLEVVIYKDEFWRTMDELVVTLNEHVSPKRYVLQSFLSHGTQAMDMTERKANGIGSVQVIDRELRSATIDSNTIKSTVNMESLGNLKQQQNYFESGLIFENGMECIEREVRNGLQIANLSIKAHNLKDTKREIQPCSNLHQDTSDDDLMFITERKETANLQVTTGTWLPESTHGSDISLSNRKDYIELQFLQDRTEIQMLKEGKSDKEYKDASSQTDIRAHEREVLAECETFNTATKQPYALFGGIEEIQPCSNLHQDTSIDHLMFITERKEIENLQVTTRIWLPESVGDQQSDSEKIGYPMHPVSLTPSINQQMWGSKDGDQQSDSENKGYPMHHVSLTPSIHLQRGTKDGDQQSDSENKGYPMHHVSLTPSIHLQRGTKDGDQQSDSENKGYPMRV